MELANFLEVKPGSENAKEYDKRKSIFIVKLTTNQT